MAEVSKTAEGTKHGNTITGQLVKIMFQVFPGIKGTDEQRGIAGVPYTFSVDGGKTFIGNESYKTTADGGIWFVAFWNTPTIVKIFNTEYHIFALDAIEASADDIGIQRRLSLLGYEPGEVNGNIWDKNTDRALLNFQADSDLNADGRIDNFTRNQLVADFGE